MSERIPDSDQVLVHSILQNKVLILSKVGSRIHFQTWRVPIYRIKSSGLFSKLQLHTKTCMSSLEILKSKTSPFSMIRCSLTDLGIQTKPR